MKQPPTRFWRVWIELRENFLFDDFKSEWEAKEAARTWASSRVVGPYALMDVERDHVGG